MNPTRSDLPEATRKAIVSLLNERLADSIHLGLQAKGAHWNVRGRSFFSLHQLFDQVYHVVEEHTDELAERITALGGIAEGDAATVQARSVLTVHPRQATETDHVAGMAESLATFAKRLRAAIEAAAQAGDAGTADLFTEVSRSIDKHLWLVEAHLDEGDAHDRWK